MNLAQQFVIVLVVKSNVIVLLVKSNAIVLVVKSKRRMKKNWHPQQ